MKNLGEGNPHPPTKGGWGNPQIPDRLESPAGVVFAAFPDAEEVQRPNAPNEPLPVDESEASEQTSPLPWEVTR